MKNLIALFSFFALSMAMMGQSSEKAKGILDKLTAQTKAYKTIEAKFSFTMENLQEDIKEQYNGSISIKGDKYKVSLMSVNTYYDGTVLYTHMLDAEEVNISEPDPEDEETLNPATIFSSYEKGFKYNFIGEGTADGKAIYEIDLYPENRDKPYSRIKLLILKDEMNIYSIRQVNKDGNNYTIIVKDMKVNHAIDDKTFVFDKAANPNVDVIDMR